MPISAKTVDWLSQRYSKRALGFNISRHSLRTTFVSRSVELEQSPSVVRANTGDSPATILKYYAKLPGVVMRRIVEDVPSIFGLENCSEDGATVSAYVRDQVSPLAVRVSG